MSQEPWSIYGQPVRGRSCGTCSFCCTMVPVERPLNKPAGVRCEHQCAKGCRIYNRRPEVCQYWNCGWLYQPETHAVRRPDRVGYAIDPMLQTILIDHQPVDVIQIWVDPRRPDAHLDPALRDYLTAMAEKHRLLAIVRWSHPTPQADQEAMVLAAPCLTVDGQWHEHRNKMITASDMAEKLHVAEAALASDA